MLICYHADMIPFLTKRGVQSYLPDVIQRNLVKRCETFRLMDLSLYVDEHLTNVIFSRLLLAEPVATELKVLNVEL